MSSFVQLGRTPLHTAAWAGQLGTIQVLLKACANANAKDSVRWRRGCMLLLHACLNARQC